MYLLNLIGHLKTITVHKYYVFIAMKDCGRPIRGLLHDMSKYSPTELFESAKYYQHGKRSPIDAAKENKGYSDAWFHHRGRNKHHSQYWVDVSFGEIKPCKIPYEVLIEHICDTIGAGKNYLKDKWSCNSPIEYWNRVDSKSYYHPITKSFVELIYTEISKEGWESVSNKLRNNYLRHFYENYIWQ